MGRGLPAIDNIKCDNCGRRAVDHMPSEVDACLKVLDSTDKKQS